MKTTLWDPYNMLYMGYHLYANNIAVDFEADIPDLSKHDAKIQVDEVSSVS